MSLAQIWLDGNETFQAQMTGMAIWHLSTWLMDVFLKTQNHNGMRFWRLSRLESLFWVKTKWETNDFFFWGKGEWMTLASMTSSISLRQQRNLSTGVGGYAVEIARLRSRDFIGVCCVAVCVCVVHQWVWLNGCVLFVGACLSQSVIDHN